MNDSRNGRRSTKGVLGGVVAAALLAAAAAPAGALTLDNKGTEFLLGFIPQGIQPPPPEDPLPIFPELHLTSDVATTATIEYPVLAPTFTTTVAVGPGAVEVVPLPTAAAQGWVGGAVGDNAVRVTAPEEVVVYLINRGAATTDAALGLPVDAMNTEFIVSQYAGSEIAPGTPDIFHGEFVVVAGHDATTVSITPTKALEGGFAAGSTFDIVLNRGEGFLGRSLALDGPDADLTGTIVRSDRPVGMTNGNRCANIPPTVNACDHIFEVAQPVQTWGKEIPVANLPNRPGGSIYRVVASEDATTILLDGAAIGTLGRGEFLDTGFVAGDHVFTSAKPIFVTQYMPSFSNPDAVSGDPAMGNMIPSEQYLAAYTFSTVGGDQFAEHFLTVIAEDADVGVLTLDGLPIDPAAFAPIGASGFSVARVPLKQGTHATSSAGVHGITVEGYNPFDSYLYPGGLQLALINPVGDANAPLCGIELLAGPPPSAAGFGDDSRPSEDANGNGVLDPGEDANGNGQIDEDSGVYFVELAPGAVNLVLDVSPFTPGDGAVSFTVDLLDPAQAGAGTVVVTDGAGNRCEAPVSLNGGGEIECCVDRDGDGWMTLDTVSNPAECVVAPASSEKTPQYVACGAGGGLIREDCDDANPAIHPAASEIPGNGADENCNGSLHCGAVDDDAAGSAPALAFALPLLAAALLRRRLGGVR